jgi:hypothetical protein
MADKVTAKNLSYTRALPPFLAKLQNQTTHDAETAGPDPLLAGRRRHAKPRSASEEAEDAPVVVDEAGREVVEGVRVGGDGSLKMVEGTDPEKKEAEEDNDVKRDREADGEVEKEKVAAIGAGKKRKAGRVIGQDGEQADGDTAAKLRREVDKLAKEAKSNGTDDKTTDSATKSTPKDSAVPPKKKAKKKIQLSFGDEEG